MIVVDASLVLDLVVPGPAQKGVTKAIGAFGAAMAAPELIDLEALQVLRRLTLRGRIKAAVAEASLHELGVLPLQRYSHTVLANRVWELRHNLTAYDAAYFVLAEFLGAPLFTRDRKFTEVPGHTVAINVI
ncbi:MAG: type II toxin-antitoxin system VapC family toxin [Pseudomonadota bacterium]